MLVSRRSETHGTSHLGEVVEALNVRFLHSTRQDIQRRSCIAHMVEAHAAEFVRFSRLAPTLLAAKEE